MSFISLIFLVFCIIFFVIYRFTTRKGNNGTWGFITAASFVFYGWWDWRYLFLIISSGLLDYCLGLYMQNNPARKKLALFLSVLGNVGTLMSFKYLGFITENIDQLFSSFGSDVCTSCQIPDFFLVVPVGISFYTFQSMSYTIDIYRGKLEPTKNVLHFFAYLSMFPQLVAGPIERASHLLPQLLERKKVTEKDRWEGTRLIVHGFFKKMVIADNLAPVVSEAFAQGVPAESAFYWWGVMTAFAFQIYCDFSGYSDIARGLARWMGFEFSMNFNHPYISSSLKEFWTRWHISLSSWFRDYLYIPLGGSKKGKFRSYINLWVTMLVSGFWHGASWNFVIWGALHSLFLTIEKITGWSVNLVKNPFGRMVAVILVIIQVWVAWVFFRAETLKQSIQIVVEMFNFTGGIENALSINAVTFITLISLRELYVYLKIGDRINIPERKSYYLEPIYLAIIITCCIFFRGEGSAFIYFQF